MESDWTWLFLYQKKSSFQQRTEWTFPHPCFPSAVLFSEPAIWNGDKNPKNKSSLPDKIGGGGGVVFVHFIHIFSDVIKPLLQLMTLCPFVSTCFINIIYWLCPRGSPCHLHNSANAQRSPGQTLFFLQSNDRLLRCGIYPKEKVNRAVWKVRNSMKHSYNYTQSSQARD